MALNTCDIADGMLLHGFDHGGELHYISQQSALGSGTISGHAYTVEFAPKADPRPALPFHYIDHVPKGSILVLATSKECQISVAPYTVVRESLYGGLMSMRAQMLGANGSVVLGLIRDIDEHEDLKYPVFSYGIGTCAANQTMKVVAVNEPINVRAGPGDRTLTVVPGDIVYADKNGVVVVPRHDHLDVVEKAELRAKANTKTAEDIVNNGKDLASSQKHWRTQFL